jgi:tRNA-splicing endonuclease subunit Sen2
MAETQDLSPALPTPGAGRPSNAKAAEATLPSASPARPAQQQVPPAPRPPPLWKIHELPAPIRTFPLPTFYPGNPLSLFHIAYAWFTHVLWSPREPSIVYEGLWSSRTRTVHIYDEKTMRALWEQGFYGKGHLSRSEPNWLKREQARAGALKDHVAEEFTLQRRQQRQQMKWDRARKEQDAIRRTRLLESMVPPVGPLQLLSLPNSERDLQQLLSDSVADGNASGLTIDTGTTGNTVESPNGIAHGPSQVPDGSPEAGLGGHLDALAQPRPHTPPRSSVSPPNTPSENQTQVRRRKSVRFSPRVESTTFQFSDPPSPNPCVAMNGNGHDKAPDSILTNGASSLSRESSMTLVDVPTILPLDKPFRQLVSRQSVEEPVNKERLQLTLEEVFFLAYGLGVLQVKDERSGKLFSVEELFTLCRQHSYFPTRVSNLQPDDPFLINYAVYHHFRSLGWVIRPGIKFGTDWLLYNRGPAFSHAEFAIMVFPSYSDPYWEAQGRTAPNRTWHWLHCVNRVQATAVKTLVMVYVDVPAPAEGSLDISSTLKRYRIREFHLRRWQINRNRD